MKSISMAMLASAFVFSAGAADAQSLECIARTLFTTSPGASNFSYKKSGAPLRSAYASAWVDDSSLQVTDAPVRVKRHRHRPR